MTLFLDSLVDKIPVMAPYYLGKNLSYVADFVAGAGPGAVREYFKKYDWLKPTRRDNVDRTDMTSHRSEGYKAATIRTGTYYVQYMTTMLKQIAREPDKLVWHVDLLSPQIFYAMGLVPFLVEMFGIMLPSVDSQITEHYIDVCENSGFPGDTCTLPKMMMGMVLDDQLPPPKAIVTSNSPCDGGMASYSVMEEKYKVPVFRLDIPYNFNEQRGMDYYNREVRDMITFLEDVFKVKMEPGKLREVCDEYNRSYEYSMELWDLIRTSPAPMGGETLVYSHLSFQLTGGSKMSTRFMHDLLRIARRTMDRDGGGIPNERHRYILWNPPPLIFPEMFAWMEKEYGAIAVMDMLTYKNYPLIDTSSYDSTLRDLAYSLAHGPMAQHTRGPCENFFGDLFHMYESYNADMIVMAGHVACKNTKALFGMFKELCRKRSIPLLIIDYDLSDTRPMSPDGIKRQVADFMENIMGEKK